MNIVKRFSVVSLVTVLAAGPALAAEVKDEHIAAIVVAANQIDIDAGKLAQSKASSKDVKAFAETMVKDHSGVNKAAGDLVTKLNVKPEESPTSTGLKEQAKARIAHLKSLKGAQFDKAYIDNEVKYHGEVLDALDKVLIPNAKNAELKDMLVKVRPAFVAHMEHAKQLQASLGKKGK